MNAPASRTVLAKVDRLRDQPADSSPAPTAEWVDLLTTATGISYADARDVVHQHPPRVATGPTLTLDDALGQLDLWAPHLPGTGAYGPVPGALERLNDDLAGSGLHGPAEPYANRQGPRAYDDEGNGRSGRARGRFAVAIVAIAVIVLAGILAATFLAARDGGSDSQPPSTAAQPLPDAVPQVPIEAFLPLEQARAEHQLRVQAAQDAATAALRDAGVADVTWETATDAEAEQLGFCDSYGEGLTAWQLDQVVTGDIDRATATQVVADVAAAAPDRPQVGVRTARTPFGVEVAISWPAGLDEPGGLDDLGYPALQGDHEILLAWEPSGFDPLDTAAAEVPGTLSLQTRSACART
jgi:hypothetical protein